MEKVNDLQAFKQFLPKQAKEKHTDGTVYAVTYTRVSSLEQFKTNGSLESQERICNKLASQMGIPVLAKFGGTYESAKTEERKEFQRMMDFIKRSKQNIKYIIVSDNDRFSRTGANAIYLADQLRAKGIQVMAASSPVDTLTPVGAFQQNIQLLFSHFDNQLRREKTIRGMMQKFEKGYYIGALPLGYERKNINGEKKIITNETAKAILKAFKLKGEQGLRTSEIAARLRNMGIPVKEKQLSAIFRNVFYCGLLSNIMLKDKLVQGVNWEPLVSKELFLKANDVLKLYHPAHSLHKENQNIPLRNFVACAKCGTMWTGYIVKQKGLYYYKCNRKGCKCNVNADKMHEQFMAYLKSHEFPSDLIEPLKRQLQITFEYMNQDLCSKKAELAKRKQELLNKISKAEEKYIEGDVEKDAYQNYRAKCTLELAEIDKNEQHLALPLSNQEKFIDFSVSLCQNLSKIWGSGSFDYKLKFQKMMFPDGLRYDLPNRIYRTPRINEVVSIISRLARISAENKKAELPIFVGNSARVAPRRIELRSKVPETFVLSIKLRSHKIQVKK